MAYTKRTWKYEGQPGAIPLNPTNLNHIEDGIEAVDLGKADKVSGATNDNLAALDTNGNLKDSGSKAGDFEAAGAAASAVGTHNADAGAHAGLNIMPALAVRYDLQGAAADLNDITDGAFFISSNNLSTAQLLEVIGGNNAYIMQIFQSAVGAGTNYNRVQIAYSYTTNKVAMRRLYQSTWSSWVPMLTGEGGTLEGDLNVPVLRVTSDTDASPTSDRHGFQVGSTDKANIAFDGNEIMARNNGAASILYLNADGGDVRVNGKSVYKADDTIPIKDGGTGGTNAATARTSLGIRTYSGSVSLAANSYYVDITCSGVTTSSMIFINNNEAVINTTEPLLVSCRATAANTVRAYTIRTKASPTTVYYHILAIG